MFRTHTCGELRLSDAGKEVTLNYPDLMINGEYVVEVEGNNGHVFQVPYNQSTGWKRP